MEFHTFGERSDPTVVLIHGVLTPWQIWEKQIAVLRERYFVVVPALDGHIEEHESEYISVEAEAQKIEAYISEKRGNEVFALCGLSMGGVIADKIFERNRISIHYLVLDGAPLIKMSALSETVMANAYKTIIHKSKSRNRKIIEHFKRDFLPERFLSSYLKIADTMSDSTVDNMIHSVCATVFTPNRHAGDTKILFMHGTKGNETYSIKAAKKMKAHYSDMVIQRFDGLKHTELAIYQPDVWLKTVNDFLATH